MGTEEKDIKEFAAYKYNCTDTKTNPLVIAACFTVIAAIYGAKNFSPWLLLLLLFPLAMIIRRIRYGPENLLVIGPRYLIVGNGIMYFMNVKTVKLDEERQTITFTSNIGKTIVIAASRFPTNARKDFKIKANTTAKFNKVKEKLMQRIKESSPGLSV